jgi:EAL and modified HD-GYP domain-containing signal transduction protein
MTEIYFARQPIYNRDFQVEGYELFYRRPGRTPPSFSMPKLRLRKLFLTRSTEVGLDRIVGPHKAFINIARDFVVGGYLEMFALTATGFRVAGSRYRGGRAAAGSRCASCTQQGYRFVLDDYTDNEAYRRCWTIADYVKIDMLVTPEDEVRRVVPNCCANAGWP